MCYKDKTYCLSDCVNTDCNIRFTKEIQKSAEKWWGGEDAPIALSDYSDTCPIYIKPKEKQL